MQIYLQIKKIRVMLLSGLKSNLIFTSHLQKNKDVSANFEIFSLLCRIYWYVDVWRLKKGAARYFITQTCYYLQRIVSTTYWIYTSSRQACPYHCVILKICYHIIVRWPKNIDIWICRHVYLHTITIYHISKYRTAVVVIWYIDV